MKARAWMGLLSSWCVLAGVACSRNRASAGASSAAATSSMGGAPGTADADLSREATAQLAAAFQRAGSEARVEGSEVVLEGHRAAVQVRVERVVDQGDHATAAIDVAMDVDGRAMSAFHVGAVGIDANASEATAHAVREWAVAYAIPIVDALRFAWHGDEPHLATASGDAGTTTPLVTLRLGPYRVFAGPTGARGEPPAGWDALGVQLHRDFLEHANADLAPLIDGGASATTLHSFKLALHVHDGAVGDGDCRVDGAGSPALCRAAQRYPWPSGPSDFLFKQFYVLVPDAAARH
jgi:hypothetical protein